MTKALERAFAAASRLPDARQDELAAAILAQIQGEGGDGEPALRLARALEAFDRARSFEASQAARERLVALGSEVVPSALAELAKPQPPERLDAIVALVVRWTSAHELIATALAAPEPNLRAALASALAHSARGEGAADSRGRDEIIEALLRLARDPHPSVRLAAVESIGLAGSRDARVRDALARIAAEDADDLVRREARTCLDELT
jgi:hypothetical protein